MGSEGREDIAVSIQLLCPSWTNKGKAFAAFNAQLHRGEHCSRRSENTAKNLQRKKLFFKKLHFPFPALFLALYEQL